LSDFQAAINISSLVSGRGSNQFFTLLGAVITNYSVIGTKSTPVRKIIESRGFVY